MDQAEVVISLITDIGMPVTLDREPYIRRRVNRMMPCGGR